MNPPPIPQILIIRLKQIALNAWKVTGVAFFESFSHLQCTQCIKMNFKYFFKNYGESNYACSFFLRSTHPMFIMFIVFKIKAAVTICHQIVMALSLVFDDRHIINSTKMMRSLLSTPGFFTNIKSDRVHCNPLSCVTSGSRCHTADYLKGDKGCGW